MIDQVPIRILQVDDQESGRSTLRVEGSLRLEDVEMLERICDDLRGQADRSVVIDLSGLTFLDGGSASILRRLKARSGVALTGLQFFTRHMIEAGREQGDP